jgi:NAD(P)-dependent dehydrogenase (short-subunit alcohol dehydrogenase family)
MMTTVLYTGGTGRMGRVIREGLAGRYDRVVLYATSPISIGSPPPLPGST